MMFDIGRGEADTHVTQRCGAAFERVGVQDKLLRIFLQQCGSKEFYLLGAYFKKRVIEFKKHLIGDIKHLLHLSKAIIKIGQFLFHGYFRLFANQV